MGDNITTVWVSTWESFFNNVPCPTCEWLNSGLYQYIRYMQAIGWTLAVVVLVLLAVWLVKDTIR